jgi:hypothetical protein
MTSREEATVTIHMRSTVCPVCQGLAPSLTDGGIAQHLDLRADAWCTGGERPALLLRGGFAARRVWRSLTRGPWTPID